MTLCANIKNLKNFKDMRVAQTAKETKLPAQVFGREWVDCQLNFQHHFLPGSPGIRG
jgi:hypothetical protein